MVPDRFPSSFLEVGSLLIPPFTEIAEAADPRKGGLRKRAEYTQGLSRRREQKGASFLPAVPFPLGWVHRPLAGLTPGAFVKRERDETLGDLGVPEETRRSWAPAPRVLPSRACESVPPVLKDFEGRRVSWDQSLGSDIRDREEGRVRGRL